MVWTARRQVGIVVCGLLLVGGCVTEPSRAPAAGGGGGGGRDGGRPPPVALGEGLDADAALSTLTSAEATAFCGQLSAAAEAALGDPVALTCTLLGLLTGGLAGGDVGVCEQTRDACLASPPAGAEGALRCDLEDAAARARCDVTVAEARVCLEDQIALLSENLDAFTCAALAAPSEPLPDPASCEGLDARCPALFGDG